MTILKISEQAKNHIIGILDRSGNAAVELGLEQQGCTGYKYTWTPVASTVADNVIAIDSDHFILVSNKVLPYVIDSELVIEQTGFNSRLSLINPHVAHSCGCGESVNFDVK